MKIYTAENKISGLILNNRAISYCTELTFAQNDQTIKKAVENYATANHKLTKDLYPVTSILVSTVWNANDDVFVKEEVWKARHTPMHHPVNIEHDEDEIIGHMTDVWAMDDHGEFISDDTDPSELPSIYSLVNASVIYTSWYGDERINKVTDLINSIEKKEMFVSMECRFEDFDYALSGEGEYRIVTRADDTADLSRHLRCFGGTGLVGSYRIGRVPRGITFVGKGFTKQPANRRSIIFTNIPAPSKEESGVQSLVAHILEIEKMPEITQADFDAVKAELNALQEKFTALTSEKESLANSLAEIQKTSDEAKNAFEAEKVELQNTIATLQLNHKTLIRENELTNAGVPADKASANVKLYISLSDEQWKPVLEAFASAAKPVVTVQNTVEAPETILASVEIKPTVVPNVDITSTSKEEDFLAIQKSIASLIKVKNGDEK